MKKIEEDLEQQLKLAGMNYTAKKFIKLITIPSAVFSINFTMLVFFVMKGNPYQWLSFLLIIPLFLVFMLVCLLIPKANARRISMQIDSDIFVPGRMLVTLLESGNSLLSAFERVSHTNTHSGKYFGKIAREIYLGKNLEEAIEDAIHNTPSKSFKRVLEPIKNSLRTGTAIEKSLLATLDELTDEKIVEIERYEKRLAPISMFYMIFGTIVPTIGVVGAVVIFSVIGLTVTFFPILAVLLVCILLVQMFFLEVFKSVRPNVKL